MITLFLISMVFSIGFTTALNSGIAIGVGEAFGLPRGFENILPEETQKELRGLYRKREIILYDTFEGVNEVMSSVPKDVLEKFPLPPELGSLPEELQTVIRQIQLNTTLSWKQRQFKIGQLIDSQPNDIKALLGGMPPRGEIPQNSDEIGNTSNSMEQPNGPNTLPFPLAPPPEYAKYFPEESYDQLLKIHMNTDLNNEEKEAKIEEVIRNLPQEVLDQLPLPAEFDMLPDDWRAKARSVIFNPKTDFKSGRRLIFEFVLSLPPQLRKTIYPPIPPPIFELLSPEDKNQVVKLYTDETLEEDEVKNKFWNLVKDLPMEIEQKVTVALKDE